MLKIIKLSKIFNTNKFGNISDNKLIIKSIKLKAQKLSKLRKKLSKSENLSKFNIKKAKLSFLIFSARKIFNYL